MTRETAFLPPWTYLNLQKRITDFVSRSSPPSEDAGIVWHYTNAAGLIGILESGYLRGTNYAFMNDASEFEYGCAVADEVLRELHRRRRGKSFFERIGKALKQFTTESEIYLACFSAIDDDLSQWRGYSSGPDRFSLGIVSSELKQRDAGALMRAVEYRRSTQQDRIRRFLLGAWKIVQSQGGSGLENDAATMLVPFLFDVLCFYKDERFLAEREWRVAKRLSASELSTAPRKSVSG